MRESDAACEVDIGAVLKRAFELAFAGKLKEAEQIGKDLLNEQPHNAHAWHLLSYVYSCAKRWHAALECVGRALSLSPDYPTFALQYGRCLVAYGRRSEALEVARRIAAIRLDRADWNDALGTLLTHCEEPARGRLFFERAVALAPYNCGYLYNLATAQRMTADLAGAEATLNLVIAAQPGDITAYYTRADLRTQTDEVNHIDEMVHILNKGFGNPQKEIMLCFAIAKELEDVARYDMSFSYLKRGCDIQRRQIKYDVADDVATINRLVQLHDCTALYCDGGFETDECIFVVGLPRSGTTLVEQILASHSAVHAAGELHAFPSEAIKAVQRHTIRKMCAVDFVEDALQVDPTALGQAYLQATRPQTGFSQRFVDKTPLNYLYAGLIRRALPRARIVALAREPMAACFAMYKTLFAGAYPFSYDLSDLGRYYAAWHRLMRHWKSVLGESLLIVQYEDLIANQEAVSRRLVAHCGLAWEEGCLLFDQQRLAVTTASAAQVRRPIYFSSVGKWRHYEHQLRPLADVLRQFEPAAGWRLAGRETAS